MKKILSIALIIIITTVFGGLMSYVTAAYIEPAGSAPANNTPAPINVDNTGYFLKLGKLGVSDDRNTNNKIREIDATAFTNNVLVVMGQLTALSLASNGEMRFRGELNTSSTKHALMVSPNGTSSPLMQTNPNASPLTFFTDDRTRAARIVVGSETADSLSPNNYNLYVEPGSKATNFGTSNSYCTLTPSVLANTGCPVARSYAGTTVGTYLGQVFVTANSGSTDEVAACYFITPSASPGSVGPC